MVEGSKKSGSARRMHVVLPSNKTVLRFKKKKVGQAKCQITGAKLAGVPRVRKMTNMPKSAKRPSRPFGGVLSPAAMKRVLIEKARSQPE